MKIALLVAIAVGIVVTALYVWHVEKTTELPTEPELCEVGTVKEDGTVQYAQNHPGQTNLLVLATQNGIRIYAPCK